MKKLSKLKLRKAIVITPAEMKHITGGAEPSNDCPQTYDAATCIEDGKKICTIFIGDGNTRVGHCDLFRVNGNFVCGCKEISGQY